MKKCRKKWGWCVGSFVLILLIVYLTGTVYFMRHFLYGTILNEYDISIKTVKEVEEIVETDIEEYELVLKEKRNTEEKISGKQINLCYKGDGQIQWLLEQQNPFLWCFSFRNKLQLDASAEIVYDKEKLAESIRELSCFSEEEIPPQNAFPKFNGLEYVIQKEEPGNGLDKERLQQVVENAIDSLEEELNLQKEGCYQKPKYTSESEAVVKACRQMNQYIQASITYTMEEPVVIDKQMISKWLSVDPEMKVVLNENEIKSWLTEFGDTYDTVGAMRTFTTPNGKNASVTGGTYGWSIDEETEFTAIVNHIKSGETVTKEPAYYVGGMAAVHGMPDWGNTYIDVDLSQQHMWCVVNGNVVLETDVVTGEPIPEKITPEGVYTILEKTMDTYLIGEPNENGEPSYRTHVDYWMRVTWSGIGFHDATWQTAFGGTLFQIPNIGSHGCINMPLDQAAALYQIIEVGTPVVIHY